MSESWKKIILSSNLYVNINDASDTHLVDITTGFFWPNIDETNIKSVLNKHEFAAYCETSRHLVDFIYDPHSSSPVGKNDDGVEILNLYRPPVWKKDNYFKGTPLPPAPQALSLLMDKYITHLTGSEIKSKEYLLDWLSVAMTGRNFTILCAIGKPGIGKGKLGEIMARLVGKSNFSKVRDTVFKSQFNAALRNKQIVYVDEVSIETKEEADRVKDVVNDVIEIERKGYDTEEQKNYASFYLSSNHLDAIKIEPYDRRFSIIELAEENLQSTLSIDEIKALTSVEEVTALAVFLLARKPANDMFKPFKSERFNKVRSANLSVWEEWLVEQYFPDVKENVVSLDIVKSALTAHFQYMHRPPGRIKLEEFLNQFPEYFKYLKIDGIRSIQIIARPPKQS